MLKRYVGFITPPSGVSWEWRTFADYLDVVRSSVPATNIAPLIGHGTVRIAVLGFDQRAPTPQELERMKALTEEAMEAGAFGLSTGLVYVPGTYSETEEIVELAKVASPLRRVLRHSHAQRGRPPDGLHPGVHRNRAARGPACPNIPSQGSREVQPRQGRGVPGTSGAHPGGGAGHNGGPVPLPRQQHDPAVRPPSLGTGGRRGPGHGPAPGRARQGTNTGRAIESPGGDPHGSGPGRDPRLLPVLRGQPAFHRAEHQRDKRPPQPGPGGRPLRPAAGGEM